jgi:hydrophobe/amphiphile efflux-1 (HAE1) family protein
VISKIFIDRPVLSVVISIIITVAGAVAYSALPTERYPDLAPPQVKVSATYPGATAETVEKTVATPIELEVNGSKGMIYMNSVSANDGTYALTVSFEIGSDNDLNAVEVQNRVSAAMAKLPREVQSVGVTTRKVSPDTLMFMAILSPEGAYDELFMSNYASINIVDELKRIPGMGDVTIVGQKDFGVRLWLRPDDMAKLGVSANDVIGAIQEQNVETPGGKIGESPMLEGQVFEYPVKVKGRLVTPDEFGDIIVRAQQDGAIVQVKDIARVELASKSYLASTTLNGAPCVTLTLSQLPGSNAVVLAEQVRETLERLKKTFPPGLDYQIAYDSTIFVTLSIEEVMHTLFEAFILVFIVIFIFLQDWRATLIPMIAVPVALIGTFAALLALGFSINLLTLFGLILAIGIVVDDAIVVVEAVAHKIEHEGLSSYDASVEAMKEVSGPVIGIALVLSAVFVPLLFLSGLTGVMFRQFAVTITVSVLISALNALTLSPALCAIFMRKVEHKGIIGKGFGAFNRGFDWVTNKYMGGVTFAVKRFVLSLIVLAILTTAGVMLIANHPTGLVPDEDQGIVFVNAQLPDGASLERTKQEMKTLEAKIKEIPGVQDVLNFSGFSIVSQYGANTGSFVLTLKPFDDRVSKEEYYKSIIMEIAKISKDSPGAQFSGFGLPALPGMGNVGGFTFELQDRSGGPIADQAAVATEFMRGVNALPEVAGAFTPFRNTVPQLSVVVDREKAKTLDVPVDEVFRTLQGNLAAFEVNDVTIYGRNYKVMTQAEPRYRQTPADIDKLWARSRTGQMVPLGTLVSVTPTTGPSSINRYNVFRTVEINSIGAPGVASGDAIAQIEATADKTLPSTMSYQWTGLTYQEKLSAGQLPLIFGMAFAFTFLFLAALYESWSIPFSVLLGVPLAVFGAILGAVIRGIPFDIYGQIGLILLIGLAAKNAILIVEFAKIEHEINGKTVWDAVMTSARLRFRPILMTSFAFILGVVPLATAEGAGSASRVALGTTVMTGMIAATVFGVYLVPVLYFTIQSLTNRISRRSTLAPHPGPPVLPETDTRRGVAAHGD